MTSPPENSPAVLIIQEHICFQISTFRVEVESHLGQSADVHYFRVHIHSDETDSPESRKLGLLRAGTSSGSLSREIQLRQALGDSKMVSELLACTTEELVSISVAPSLPPAGGECNPAGVASEPLGEYLEEEFFEPKQIAGESSAQKIIMLSYLPDESMTLAAWLTRENPLEQSLLVASQVCQFFRYVWQQGWCFISIFPPFIQMGTPVKLFDLTGAYRAGEKLASGLIGDYCPPETSYSHPVDEQMSAYVVGALLYHSIHQKLPNLIDGTVPPIKPIPRISQLLSICLSPSGERFSLPQLLSLLVDIRQSLRHPQVHWDVAGRSTAGLSPERLQNEDSYGVRQQYSSNQPDSFILAVVADGMGGMAQGEVASRLAVQTLIEAPIPTELNTLEKRAQWLDSLVWKANECVAESVRDGGTTLSAVLAFARDLMIAHVGDSRIFLLRNGLICQLSEDHSLVAMLLAGGQITYCESKHHPERNVLTKSLGSKRTLSPGYIQDLSRFGSGLSVPLESGDILLLCSDGVWDLVDANELAEIFTASQSLQFSVSETIERTIARGAPDNATILALKCSLEHSC